MATPDSPSTEETITPRCIVCGVLTTEPGQTEHMNGATAWTGHGNYGSRVLDEYPRALEPDLIYEIHVCDVCLLLHCKSVLVYEHTGEGDARRRVVPPKIWDRRYTPYRDRIAIVVYEAHDGSAVIQSHGKEGGISSSGATSIDEALLEQVSSTRRLGEKSKIADARASLQRALVEHSASMARMKFDPAKLVARTNALLDRFEQRFPDGRYWLTLNWHGVMVHTDDKIQPKGDWYVKIVPNLQRYSGMVSVSLGEKACSSGSILWGDRFTIEGELDVAAIDTIIDHLLTGHDGHDEEDEDDEGSEQAPHHEDP